MKTQSNVKIELIAEFRNVIHAQNSKIVKAQSELIKGEYESKVFEMLQEVISDNFQLWDELFKLENEAR